VDYIKKTGSRMSQEKNTYTTSLEKARAHLAKNEYKNARLMYFQAYNHTESNSDRAIIWAELSWVYYYEKNYEKAIEAAENVSTYDSEYKAMDDLNRLLGYSYIALRNDTLAERYLINSLELNATDDKQQYVKYELGKIYFTRGGYDLAYPYFNDARDFFETNNKEYFQSILFYLGFINYYLENLEKSREYFEQILTENPSDQRKAGAFFGLAFVEFRVKNYLNVISLCEKIMDIDQNFFDRESVGFLTAASYFYLGRKDIFQEYYQEMIKSYPQGRYRQELDVLSRSEPDTQNTSGSQEK
jgi:tetratricopeptide (TPR) repeat protein